MSEIVLKGTYICKVGVDSGNDVHVRLSYKAGLVLGQVNKISNSERKVFHMGYFAWLEVLTFRELVIEIQEFLKVLAGPHVSPIDQLFEIRVENDFPFFYLLLVIYFEQGLTGKLLNVWV